MVTGGFAKKGQTRLDAVMLNKSSQPEKSGSIAFRVATFSFHQRSLLATVGRFVERATIGQLLLFFGHSFGFG